MNATLNREALLKKLDRIEYKSEDKKQEDDMSQMDIGNTLLLLADIKQEREWELCRSVAEHLLDEVPEPDDIDLGEE